MQRQTDISDTVDNGATSAEVVTAEAAPENEVSTDLAPVENSIYDVAAFEGLEVVELELAGNYWTPEKEGEYKDVIFDGLSEREKLDDSGEGTGEFTTSVNFYTMNNEGAVTHISNATARLVGIFNDARFEKGMSFRVTYLGKKDSRTSQFKYDDWSVKPLRKKAS